MGPQAMGRGGYRDDRSRSSASSNQSRFPGWGPNSGGPGMPMGGEDVSVP